MMLFIELEIKINLIVLVFVFFHVLYCVFVVDAAAATDASSFMLVIGSTDFCENRFDYWI